MLRRSAVVLYLPALLLCTLTSVLSLNQEGRYLLQAKRSFDDPNSVLSDWDPRDATPCKWNGVGCDSSTGAVVSLDLSSSNLSGPFPTVLCSLQSLAVVSFYDNFINSTFPENDIVSCRSLQHIDLAQNYLTGELPRTLPELPGLKYLDLTGNNFSGEIPDTYGRFPKLEVLALVENLLEGTIPAVLGNISTLKQLNLSYNPFNPGRIPAELGNLSNLEVLWLTETNLVGEIPGSLGQLSRLTDLDLAYNYLAGAIPAQITGLTGVVQIELYNNSLTGDLPKEGWSNLTNLRRLDASMNQLTGEIPAGLCRLPLESLNLYENNLSGELPYAVADSPNLYELRLFQNQLTGNLPANLGKNSPLRWLDVSTNQFSGGIPATLCEKGDLEELLLIENSFSGQIPASLGDCHSVLRLRLGKNQFSGEVPATFWGLPHVSLLDLADNSFSGPIAETISKASNLSQLVLSSNSFSGSLPEEIGSLDGLVELSLGSNKLSGSLPGGLANLRHLLKLDLHGNEFSGEIPGTIGNLKKVNELNLANNAFAGEIPDEIGELTDLNYLDLSENRFSGKIPSKLQNLKLNRFNFSNNQLSGEIPSMYAKKTYRDSFLGNPGLCGDIQGLCSNKTRGMNSPYAWILKSIFVLAALVLIAGLAWLYAKHKNFEKAKRSFDKSKWTLMSFHKLGFSEDEILDALDEDNVVGAGASGKVYKVVLNSGEAVAVKKLWGRSKASSDDEPFSGDDLEKGGGRDDGFEAEVETLGKVRHKNIVKLWCCCTARDCKLLVYEFMANGSLGDALHGPKGGSALDWPARFRIALDAAEGLSYLHHDCVPPIVHRDIKSNNILLDSEFGAKVADFGVAKAVGSDGNKAVESMSVIAGSCGYIAPEYAYTLRVNEKSDIYSFGVVVLELVTGKRPVDPEYGEKDLVKWVCTTLDHKGADLVIDPKLDACFKDEILRVLNIGLLCTSPLPINRPSMRRVVQMLLEVSDGDRSRTGRRKDGGKLTPYYYEDASENGSVA